MQTLIPFLIALAAGTVSNILIKIGMQNIPQSTINATLIIKILAHPTVLLGIFFLAASFPFYALVLQKIPLSVGFPLMTSTTFILVAFISYFFLKEPLTLTNFFGILLLIAGLFLVAQR